MRLFIALEIPSAVRNKLAPLIGELHSALPGLRWVTEDKFHLTLKFLGETPQEKMETIHPALASVKLARAFSLRCRGLGSFCKRNAPGVVFAQIEDSSELGELVKRIEENLSLKGFPRENRAFTPHLTLARSKPNAMPGNFREVLKQYSSRDFGAFQNDQFQLVQSELKSSGAEYTTLQSYSFVAEA